MVLLFVLMSTLPAHASSLEFSVHKLESGVPGHTILIVGGIQGDEPGGFNAASLITTQYKIKSGNIWVVPNLNFLSIIKRSRGVYGDLNRKFDELQADDPEYKTIEKIKSLILNDQVDLVLNLHDGSGFFRETYMDKLRNPNRWGQCIIADQETIEDTPFGGLADLATQAVNSLNGALLKPDHTYTFMNTRTREGNVEMAKTLSYFAIRNRKPAFGIEASKSLPTHERAYYHLTAIESFMKQLDIQFERGFTLSAAGIKHAINDNVKFALNDSRIVLDVKDARRNIRYIPMRKEGGLEFFPSNPLMAAIDTGEGYRIYYGNRRVTWLHPEYFDYDTSVDSVGITVDGVSRQVQFGDIVPVKNSFNVHPTSKLRVNVIGFTKKGFQNESGVPITKNNIQKRFSVDKSGMLYRVEFYNEEKFSGMVLVNFSEDALASGGDVRLDGKEAELVGGANDGADPLDAHGV
ncbi:M14 family metallopeptidase [Desulfoluna sp.]|uniref:M14 family metallopeptidase n=1 Tax=Desulfoluna sp. TaxID=2045199 RepID=UPI00260F2C99|nr:M14 family metallopeptidase [Desulfoluna sp.]